MDARVQKMIGLWEWFCAEANLGYDQRNRWDFPEVGDTKYAGECDCSSLMYHCAVLAGFPLPTAGTRYTGTMRRDFTAAGFVWVPISNRNTLPADMPAGAILYKSGHTGGWTGSKIAEAYGDERGGSTYGQDGDQANEVRLSPPRGGWEGYFVWPTPKNVVKWPLEVEKEGDMADYIIEQGSNGVPHENDQPLYSCRWEKWASGKLVVLISDYFGGGRATKSYRGLYYLDKVLEYGEADGIPAFLEPPYMTAPCVRAANGWANVQFHDIGLDKASFWVSSPSRDFPRFCFDVRLEGSWK